MSEREIARNSHLPRKAREVKVEITKTKRHTHDPDIYETINNKGIAKVSSRSNDFVYVNSAYVGSVNSVASASVNRLPVEQPTTVIREQYWACAKWPYAQKVLALSVGILLGALIGLSITLALKDKVSVDDVIGGIYRSAPKQE
nr:uncharacterized protein LOC128672726 [Plodia interpunctella]